MKPKKKAPLLSALTKQRLKKGVAAALVAGTVYLFRQQIKEQGGALGMAALKFVDKLIGKFEAPRTADDQQFFGPFQVIDDDEEPFASPSRSSLSPDQLKRVKRRVKDFQQGGRRSSRSNKGQRDVYNADGKGLGSPCAHMKEAGRLVFEMAETGNKIEAKKEIKQLSNHMKEIKKYVASL